MERVKRITQITLLLPIASHSFVLRETKRKEKKIREKLNVIIYEARNDRKGEKKNKIK